MSFQYPNTYFSTFAINNFIPVFKDFPETNRIILDCFKFLVEENLVKIFSFVIMRNHIHLVWMSNGENEIDRIIFSFKKYTGNKIISFLKEVDKDYLSNFWSERKDRDHKLWKLNIGNILIHDSEMLNIKIRYIHNNPTKGHFKAVDDCVDYYYSSAKAYSLQSSNFSFLKIIDEVVPWC